MTAKKTTANHNPQRTTLIALAASHAAISLFQSVLCLNIIFRTVRFFNESFLSCDPFLFFSLWRRLHPPGSIGRNPYVLRHAHTLSIDVSSYDLIDVSSLFPQHRFVSYHNIIKSYQLITIVKILIFHFYFFTYSKISLMFSKVFMQTILKPKVYFMVNSFYVFNLLLAFFYIL